MDRRWGGLVILAVAVLIAFAGTGHVTSVAGTAVAGPVPDPPAVGDCLLEQGAANPFDDSADFSSLRPGRVTAPGTARSPRFWTTA